MQPTAHRPYAQILLLVLVLIHVMVFEGSRLSCPRVRVSAKYLLDARAGVTYDAKLNPRTGVELVPPESRLVTAVH